MIVIARVTDLLRTPFEKGISMITAVILKLDINNAPIRYSSSRGKAKPIKYDFSNGDTVYLKRGNVDIEVRDVEKLSNDSYKGVVYDFMSDSVLESEGVCCGVDIGFSYNNIFFCKDSPVA